MLLLLSLLPLLAPARAAEVSLESVRASIPRQLASDSVPSLAVAVARNGRILWEEGFGWADRENRVPATEHTMYSLASISKPITATGLMVLVERGAIALDRPMDDYIAPARLTGHAGDARQATVRRVASHSAGLPLHYHFFYADEPYRPPPMTETIRRYGILVTAPGERYQYSNIGFGILDYAIARTSGKPYADFLREEVFLPLGLTRTSVHIGPGLAQHAAARYTSQGALLPFYDFDHAGGSAVFASAHDLVRFGLFHLKARLPEQRAILTDGAIDEMQKPLVATGPGRHYGIGWAIEERAGYKVVLHTGGMGGVRTILMLVPAERIAIVALCNGESELPMRVAGEILATLLPRLRDWKAPRPEEPPQSFRPGPLEGRWMGHIHTHDGPRPLTLEVMASGLVQARIAGQLQTLVNAPRFHQGYFTGRLTGDIGTEDASRRPHDLQLLLRLDGNVLKGSVTAMSRPGPRTGNALSSWTELKRQ